MFDFNDTLWKVPEVILKNFSFLLSCVVCYAQLAQVSFLFLRVIYQCVPFASKIDSRLFWLS